ncbi:hypothetical protein D3C71_1361400 [compost metagenome]
MDLCRGACRRGAAGDVVGVPGLAVGQCAHAIGAARGRHVFGGDETAQRAVGRHDPVLDHALVFGGQPRLVFGGKVFGQVADRAPEQAFLGGRFDHRIQLRQHLFHQRARLHHASGHAFAHVDDGLVEQGRDAQRTPRPVLVVLDRAERLRTGTGAQHRDDAGQVVVLVDRHHPGRVLLTG